ncbi:hypothetical protein NGUA15_03548 [Salmonella enterica]|nr:hypothetical protein NGUA15_03548 [Salmonella enterica]CGY64534.1 Uncharacterised protein [Salmonella enterica subsp. enterica serovar Typhi]
MLHRVHLLANSIGINTQQVVATATKLSRYLHIIVVVKNGLLHMQLISICIQQRVQNRRSELCHRCAVASSHGSV